MDRPTDKSDLLSILKSIESMYAASQNVLNSYTQTAILLAITTEAEMLLLKTRVMEQRWKVHLPFKETTGVNLDYWSKKVRQMATAISGDNASDDETIDEYCPTKHYLLDLYECLDESPSHDGGAPYYAETEMRKFIAEQNRLRKQLSGQWDEYKERFDELVPNNLEPELDKVFYSLSENDDDIRRGCCQVLLDLSDSLGNLLEISRGKITNEQFARLAERVFLEDEYGGRTIKHKVMLEVNESRNATPESQWETRRNEEIKTAIDLIQEMELGDKIFSYIGSDRAMTDNLAGLGRFLWSVRHNISNQVLSNLIELLYTITFLYQDKEQQDAEAAAAATAVIKANPKSAEAIYAWRNSITPQQPSLPSFFDPRLANNKSAVKAYYKALHSCGFYIGRPLTEAEKKDQDLRGYKGWKWLHLREAFVRMKFFRKDSSKKSFAEYLAAVFPYLEATNIQRGFNARSTYVDANITEHNINAIISEFDDVTDMLS